MRTIAILLGILSLLGSSGCAQRNIKFAYIPKHETQHTLGTRPNSIAVKVQDCRSIKNKKLLGNAYSLKFVNSQNLCKIFQDAFELEAQTRGYPLSASSLHVLQIDIEEICWGENGLIKASASVLVNKVSIFKDQFITAVPLTAKPDDLLYEFVQDILSDRQIVSHLTTHDRS